jgi:molybdopterin/thiamine biosynthesis adenylyltransferase
MNGESRTALLAADVLGTRPPAERLVALRDEPLAVALAPALAETWRGQAMLLTAATLLGRLFDYAPTIRVDASGAGALDGLPGLRAGEPLAEQIVAHLGSLPSRGTPYRYETGNGDRARRALVIGDAAADSEQTIHIDGGGWVAALGTRPPRLDLAPGCEREPFGALLAAALGAAEIARLVFRSLAPAPPPGLAAPSPERLVWDVWSHEVGDAAPPAATMPRLPPRPRLGRLMIVGMGALGAAAVWAFAHLPAASGEITLVDDDRLEPTNLERVLGARRGDVRRPKVDVGARTLAPTRLQTRSIRKRLGPWIPRGVSAATLLVGVDSGEARRQIARLRPRAIYNGGTQTSEFLVSRHVGEDGPCLECLYPDVPDPIGRTARRLGIDRATAAALVSGERRIDAEVLAAMRRRGGIRLRDADEASLLGQPLGALEAGVCSRAVVIEDLPEASVSFTAALCGFLMAAELVKDRVGGDARRTPLDAERPVFRADPLLAPISSASVEAYRARRGCPCGRRPPDSGAPPEREG